MLCIFDFFKLFKINPFWQAITISFICNKVFRTIFLKPHTVGIPMSYRQCDEALQWLAYIGQTKNNPAHAGNGRDVYLPCVQSVKVDGYCAETRKIFEYLGWFWHGCR